MNSFNIFFKKSIYFALATWNELSIDYKLGESKEPLWICN